MGNLTGLLAGYLFIFLVLGIAALLLKLNKVSADDARKIVHIGVSNWWFLLMIFFNSIWFALIGPVSFIILNMLSLRFGFFSAMEEGRKRYNLGTVYFPISLTALVLLCFLTDFPLYLGGAAILVMGYGDGLAAVAGPRIPVHEIRFWGNRKSVGGMITMFIASFISIFLMILFFGPGTLVFWKIAAFSAGAGIIGMILEGATPFGLDNLTVPAGVASFLWVSGAGILF